MVPNSGQGPDPAPPPLEGDPLSRRNLAIRDQIAYAILLERRARASERSQLQAQLHARTMELEKSQTELDGIRRSRGWRAVQRLAQFWHALPLPLRQLIRAAYWIANGRFRSWLRAGRRTEVAHGASTASAIAASEPGHGYALAVPFQSNGSVPIAPKIAIFALVDSPDSAGDLNFYLSNFPSPPDVYLCAIDELCAVAARRALGKSGCSVDVRVRKQQRHAMRPPILEFFDVLQQYEQAIMLGGALSRQSGGAALFRHFLLESIAGTPAIVESILSVLESKPQVGLVSVHPMEELGHCPADAPTSELIRRLARDAGLDTAQISDLDQPLGGVVWARISALQPLLAIAATLNSPQAMEGGGVLLTQAFDRLYFLGCERAGYQRLHVGRPEFYTNSRNILDRSNEEDESLFPQPIRDGSRNAMGENSRPITTGGVLESRSVPQLRSVLIARALGRNLSPPARPYRITIGIYARNSDGAALIRAAVAAAANLAQSSMWCVGDIVVMDACADAAGPLKDIGNLLSVPATSRLGRSAAHACMMQRAFSQGAQIYLVLEPTGILAPTALENLLRALQATPAPALVEACLFPVEHPKRYDPTTLETDWITSTCLAVSRSAFELLGAFDPNLTGTSADLDFSWRARAQGVSLRTCPPALFLGPRAAVCTTTAQTSEDRASAIRLLRKWNGPPGMEARLTEIIADLREVPPSEIHERVPADWEASADFAHLPGISQWGFCTTSAGSSNEQ